MGSDVKIARALISVTDKTGVVDFARTLVDDFGVEIISTGGTARAIEDAGVPVTPIEEFTGYPEMMDGRVKTLHPKVHGALLARRRLTELGLLAPAGQTGGAEYYVSDEPEGLLPFIRLFVGGDERGPVTRVAIDNY